MAPKKDKAPPPSPKPAKSGGGKQKEWSRGKQKKKVNNAVLFDQPTYDKLLSEVPKYKQITPSVLSERLRKAVLLLVGLTLPLLLPSSSVALNQDFCIADLSRGDTPAGYPCKPQSGVTADDFYYGGLATTGPTINPFNIGLSSAFVTRFPGVNGLGISAARVDFAPGGVVPLHSHPGGTELLFVVEGTVAAGLIGAQTNRVFTKTLRKGDLMVFPQGLLHFQYNPGNDTAVALSSYSSANPGLMILDFALFANDLPSNVVSKVTVLDELQVRKLKALFGGSG